MLGDKHYLTCMFTCDKFTGTDRLCVFQMSVFTNADGLGFVPAWLAISSHDAS